METTRFLRPCRACGGMNGEVAAHGGSERAITVSCRCRDGLCPRCGRPTLAAITNHSYDELVGRFWHAPMSRGRCASCGIVS